MTEIRLEADESYGYGTIEVSGHSGYAEKGSDILCAYISSATDLVMCILMDTLGAKVETKIDAGSALVRLAIPHCRENDRISEAVKAVTCGFASQMEDFSKQFPNYVRFTFADR